MIPQAARFAPELNSGGRRSLLQNTGCERTDGRFKPGNSQSVKPPNLACVKILICGRGIPGQAAPRDGHTEGCWCRSLNTLDTSTSPEPMARPAARARNRSIHQLSAFDSNNSHNGVATLEEGAHRLQRKSGKGSAHARRDKATSRPESLRMRRGRSRRKHWIQRWCEGQFHQTA